MSGSNSDGDRRLQLVFDAVLKLSVRDQGLFFCGVFGLVQARVCLGSALDNVFVSSVEDVFAQVKKMEPK